MEFSTRGKDILAFGEIVQNDKISSERMKQVLKAAADKVVVSNGDYHATLENGVRVNITRDGFISQVYPEIFLSNRTSFHPI